MGFGKSGRSLAQRQIVVRETRRYLAASAAAEIRKSLAVAVLFVSWLTTLKLLIQSELRS